VKEAKVSFSGLSRLPGSIPADYFWNVTATDGKKQISERRRDFKFTLVRKASHNRCCWRLTQPSCMDAWQRSWAAPERGAALIVTRQSVPNVSPDGTFRHFTEALEPGAAYDFDYRVESPGWNGDEAGVHRGSEVRYPRKDRAPFALVSVSGDNDVGRWPR